MSLRIRVAAVIAFGVCVAWPSGVRAATPMITAQARAADAAFLAYAPPPARGAGALCLVDTGVFANTDTTPGLVGSVALDGGSGSDVDPDGHGTTMAMIAGAAGAGMVGAWPALRVVSVRATTAPSPGQEPTFEFNDYWEGIQQCLEEPAAHVEAIDLALSSAIPPSPDQAQKLQTAVAQAGANNVAIVAAAGNTPGGVEQPGAQPGILAVGGFTAQPDRASRGPVGSVCSFSANQGLTLFGPGCGLDQADPFADQPMCCGDGTSQASAFTAAVLVALMSYDPALSASQAEQLLVGTATDGDLNVTAAFQAAGLGAIVAAGNANIPGPGAAHTPGPVALRAISWKHGVLSVTVAPLPARTVLHVQLDLAHRERRITTTRDTLRVRTPKPRLIELRLVAGRQRGPVLKARL